jgi:hypothetical protein
MNRSTFSSIGIPVLLLFVFVSAFPTQAQTCIGEVKPLKPINCQNAAPACLCDELGLNCRWIWSCTPRGYDSTTSRAEEPSRPAGGIDARIPLMVQPPQAGNSGLDILLQYAVAERLSEPRTPPPPVHPTTGAEWRAVLAAKSVYLVNASHDGGLFEGLYGRLQKWGRWGVVQDERDADLILALSDGYEFNKPRYLAVLHPRTRARLFFVSCERRVTAGYTAGVLVNRLRKRIEAINKRPIVPVADKDLAAVGTNAAPPVPERWASMVAVARERYGDWDAATKSAETERLAITPAMTQAVFGSQLGADLVYWLAKHPEECRRIAALSPTSAAMELGRIEERLAAVVGK